MKKPIRKIDYRDDFNFWRDMERYFYKEIMPKTRKAIRELKSEADREFKDQARVEYLKGQMSERVVEEWGLMERYEDYHRRDRVKERLLTGERIQAIAKNIIKLQGEIIFLKKGDKADASRITPEMKDRAKAYPMSQLVEVNRHNMAHCPWHEDKHPSFSIKGNYGYCFSCQWKGDVIDFIMQKDGLSFPDAVRRLL